MTNVFQESLVEAFENLFELSQKTMDKAAKKLLDKSEEKRKIVYDLKRKEQYWNPAGMETIRRLEREIRKHSNAAAEIITGK